MEIRSLRPGELAEAVGLKVLCWPEETAGRTELRLDAAAELAFFTDWAEKAEQNDDVRLLLGAFEDGCLLGVAFGSFVESKSAPAAGFELNGLWVYPAHRGRGVSLALLRELLRAFRRLGATKLLAYNFHHAPSNGFYRHLGCTVVDTDFQTKDRIPTDLFAGDVDRLLRFIDR